MSECVYLNKESLHGFLGAINCHLQVSSSVSGGDLEAALRDFFECFGPALEDELRTAHVGETQIKESITSGWVEEFVRKFQGPLDLAKKAGVFCDPWEVASLHRDEVRNAKVLAWILDCHGSHGMGPLILKTMLALLKRSLPPKFYSISMENIRDFNVSVESCPDGFRNNRVDIEIEGENIYLIVEVKVDAPQGLNQINRYCDIASKKSNNRAWAVIYLTPDGRAVDGLKNIYKEEVVQMSWRNVSKSIKSSIKKSRQDMSSTSCFLVEKFANYIQNF